MILRSWMILQCKGINHQRLSGKSKHLPCCSKQNNRPKRLSPAKTLFNGQKSEHIFMVCIEGEHVINFHLHFLNMESYGISPTHSIQDELYLKVFRKWGCCMQNCQWWFFLWCLNGKASLCTLFLLLVLCGQTARSKNVPSAGTLQDGCKPIERCTLLHCWMYFVPFLSVCGALFYSVASKKYLRFLRYVRDFQTGFGIFVSAEVSSTRRQPFSPHWK